VHAHDTQAGTAAGTAAGRGLMLTASWRIKVTDTRDGNANRITSFIFTHVHQSLESILELSWCCWPP